MKKYLMLATASLAVMWGSSVFASIIVTLEAVVPNGSNWDWVYRADLQPDETLRQNDYFGVFDVQTFIGADFGANDPSNQSLFTPSHQPLGVPGNPAPIGTETGSENFFVTYTGSTPIVGNPNNPAITLGDLVVRTNTNLRAPSFFLAQSLQTGQSQVLNSGPIDVAAAVPEPASLIFTVIGLMGVGAVAFRRRNVAG